MVKGELHSPFFVSKIPFLAISWLVGHASEIHR
ncbi:hypothetical protein EC835_103324 [Providencia alcalifaciens]|uniref:Uncharacterized protein n=1 Tax=Providencia alcalifaciens TaxID=126385 RepID=A0A4R3NMU7_9GAMM|nr:hypothetical protein EC835_103324 [Providencia alcalifaciens]